MRLLIVISRIFLVINLLSFITYVSTAKTIDPHKNRAEKLTKDKRSVLNNSLTNVFTLPTLSYTTPNTLVVGTAVNLTATVTGGTASGYTVSGTALPAGLALNGVSGAITGTPTGVSGPTTYTIKANGVGSTSGTITATLVITVNPTAPTITASPSGGSGCGAGSVILTASNGAPTGGTYSWYASATATVIATGATYSPVSSGTYYASYTSGAYTSTRTASTVTINPTVSTPLSGALFAYPFNGNANDVTGNGNTGTPTYTTPSTGPPTLSADRFGDANSAYTFDGKGQYISTTTKYTDLTVFTLSLWFNTTTTSGGKLIGWDTNQPGPGSGQFDRHVYMNNAGQLYFGVYNGATNTINSINSYNDGAWHHVVATFGPTGGETLYVDGAMVASNTSYTVPENDNGYWRVGGDNLSGWPSAPTSNYFAGQIDDIGVYSTEQTAAQVASSNNLNIIGTNAPVCVNSPITFYGPNISGATYTWTDPKGYEMTGQNPVFASAASGNYTLTVTGGPGGCSSTATVTPTLYAAPSALFTVTSPASTSSSSTVSYTGTDPSSSTYAWTFSGGSPSTGTGQGPFTITWASAGSKTVTLTVTNSNGCSATTMQTVSVENYAFKLPITLNTTSLGISSNLSNFPFLVTITDPSLVITTGGCSNKVQFPNGPDYDFEFVDGATNTEVPFDVESYNSTTGTLLVWVKIPTLTYATNNTLNFYYGSLTAPGHTTAFHQSTWASDYQAVYHFNEAAYTGSETDATTNGHTGTDVSMTSANFVTGKIGNAYNFAGSQSIAVNPVNVNGPFTISAWINVSKLNTDQKVMTNESTSGLSSGGYKLGVFSNNIPEAESGGSETRGSGTSPTALTSGTWYYVQGVFNGSTLSTYVNGIQYNIFSTTNAPTSTANYYIGVGEGGSNYYFNGIIDEPRVSNVAKSSDWLLAEYKNQNSPSTYTTTGSINTNITNAELINGGATFTTTDGANFTYSSGGSNVAGTPTNNGKENFVVAGAGVTFYTTASIYGLTVNSSDGLNLNGQTLNVGCDIVNNGVISDASFNSTLIFNGSSATQSYTGTNVLNTGQVANLTINNSAGGTITIGGGPLNLYNTLNLTKGNLVVSNATNGVLTLKSTTTLSASATAIASSYSVTGNVNVERSFKSGSIAANTRNYRLLSSPVNNGSAAFNLSYLNTNSGGITGVFVAGPTGTGGGFTVNNYTPTIYLYNESLASSNSSFNSGNFKGLSNISTGNIAYNTGYSYVTLGTIPSGNGFMLYYVGNNVNNVTSTTALNKQYRYGGSYIDPDASTTTAIGTLNQGSIPVSLWWNNSSTLSDAHSGYNLLGNPYASSIDLNTMLTGGLNTTSVSKNVYVFNYSSKNYGVYPVATGGTTGTNNASNIIASGQGFFVVATATTGAAFTFTESAKTTTQPNTYNTSYLLLGLPKETAQTQLLRVKVAKDTVDTDDIMVFFDPAAKNEYEPFIEGDRLDGLGNVSTLASYSSNSPTMLAVNYMHSIDSTTRVKLYVNISGSTGIDTLYGTGFETLDPRYDVYLLDHYKKDSLLFSVYKQYLFNIDATDTNSYGANRFEIVFHKKLTLAYRLLSFTATRVKTGIQLTWTTSDELNLTGFQLQRADGSMLFIPLNSLQSDGSGKYTYIDTSPLATTNFYRLQQDDPFDVISFSNIISVNINGTNNVKEVLTLYPNPVSSMFNITINTNAPSQVLIKVTNASGQTLINSVMDGNNIQQVVNSLLPGSYVVQVIDNSTKKVIGEKKFIKQ